MKKQNIKNQSGYKIGLYVRVSTEEQAENPEGSIKSQEHRLREFVKHKNAFENFGEIAEFYCDAGISAKDTNRPAFQKMMDDVRSQKINMILITELSRLTRSIRDFANLVEMLDELECQIYSLKDQFDSSTAVGSFSMFLMANLAQFERKQIGERISANFLSRAKRGLYNGGSVPLGYRVSGKQDGRLEVIPSEAETVREIFKTFLAEGTLSSATKALNKRKVQLTRRKEGGGQPRTGVVMIEGLYKLLTNPVYIGLKTYKEKGKEHSVKAQWEPIINEDIFNRVGEILKNNRSRKKSSPLRWPYLLSGKLYCQCGHRLSGKSAHGNGGKIAYYDHAWTAKLENATDQKSKRCDPQRVLAEKLEPIVWKAVKDFLLVPEFFTEILLEAQNQSELHTPKQEIERKQNKIYEINMQLDSLSERLGLLPKSVNPKHVFDQMEKLSIQKDGLEKNILELKQKNEMENIAVGMADFKEFKAVIVDLLENENDPVIKTGIIQKIVHKIIVKSDEVEIFFYVGEKHYKRELAIAGSRFLPIAVGGDGINKSLIPEKRHSSSLPVFHGNPRTVDILDLKPNSALENNFHDAGSNSLKIGSESHPISERRYLAVIIKLPESETQAINSRFAELYKNGYSLRDISKSTGRAKSVIQRSLVSMGIELRPNVSTPFFKQKKETGKSNTQPPYGFCYFQGKVVPDQKEYENLMLIYELWKLETNPNRIADTLTEKKIQPRLAKSWNRNSVINILNRFENKQIILKGGHLELR